MCSVLWNFICHTIIKLISSLPIVTLTCQGRQDFPRRLRQVTLRNLSQIQHTLHGVGIETSQSLTGILLFLIFINPFSPIDLEVLIFLSGLDQSWPKFAISALLLEGKEHVESSFAPFGLLDYDLLEELQWEGVFLLGTFSFEEDMCGAEVYFFIDDIHKM